MKRHLNKPVAALYTALASVGSICGYAIYDRHQTTVQNSADVRTELQFLLPLTRRITAAMPDIEWETFSPEASIRAAEDLLLSPENNAAKNCRALLDLRQIHAIATLRYQAADQKPALPLDEHTSILKGTTPTRDMCAARLNR